MNDCSISAFIKPEVQRVPLRI